QRNAERVERLGPHGAAILSARSDGTSWLSTPSQTHRPDHLRPTLALVFRFDGYIETLQFLCNFFRQFPGSLGDGLSRLVKLFGSIGTRKSRFCWHLRGRRWIGRWIGRRRVGHKYRKGEHTAYPFCCYSMSRLRPFSGDRKLSLFIRPFLG